MSFEELVERAGRAVTNAASKAVRPNLALLRRVRRRRAVVGGVFASLVGLAAFIGIGSVLLGRQEPPPAVTQSTTTTTQPPATTTIQPPATTTPEDPSDDAPAVPTLASLAVASTMALDDGATYESRFSNGTVVRAVGDGVAYPERLYGLADGTVVWEGANGIYALAPDETAPSMLVPRDAGGAVVSRLVGVGTMDDEPVALIWESRASSPEDDSGGALYADPVGPAGDIRRDLVQFPSAWEVGVEAASLRNGWLLYTVGDSGGQTVILRAPDGTETFIEDSYGEGHTLQAAALAELDIAPGLAVVEHHVDHGDPDAPFGAARLEVRSVEDSTAGEPAWSIELPTDNVPKQLTVAGEWAYLTLLPDAPELLQVNLHSGEIERYSAPGVVALHARLQPRSPDAAPPGACAESSGTDDDAQAYVWLPCPDAATYEEGDPPARFFGIHRVRLVTDPRASTGGVAQRVEAMLETVFAGPTPEEQQRGYSGVIDPSVDALVGVTFADGLVTIELTEEGARAASAGTTARAVFQTTVNAAVFGGFVDVDALRITVEGDCVAWSTYGEGPPVCLTYQRDGTTTQS